VSPPPNPPAGFWTPDSVAAALLEEPYRFGFFQAVRVLARLFPERRRVGMDAVPEEEIVRFGVRASLVFPPSEIYDLQSETRPGHPLRLVIAFMGLTGPAGALPRVYTELLLERIRKKDYTLHDFLDLFNHRLISLFYRAWEKTHFWLNYETAEIVGRHDYADSPERYRAFVTEVRPQLDIFSQALLDLTGMGFPGLRYRRTVRDRLAPRTTVTDGTVRYFAGLLAQQHRSAVGLEGMLQDSCGVPATVLQCVGQWLRLDRENQTRLRRGGNAELGTSAMAGDRFWDVQGKFRIQLGPLTYRQFEQFLPVGSGFRRLRDLARLYAGAQFDMDLQLRLRAAEVPSCRLCVAEERGPRLGWNTWIRSGAFTRDADDAILRLEDEPLG
jgi:type VI secretion system protein ImpH